MVKRKKLNKADTLVFSEHFPYRRKTAGSQKHKALLGIGGNIGDVLRRFEHLFILMRASKFIRILETAPILKNPPFGYLEQDDFYNSLILIETDLTPRALLRYILRIEKHFGRKRLFKDAPRTLDIDMIFYDAVQMHSKELTLPHPAWMQRNSVLIPLSMMKGRTT